MPAASRNREIQSRNGSSFDPAGCRRYGGGSLLASARRIVLRCTPKRRLICDQLVADPGMPSQRLRELATRSWPSASAASV